MMRSSALFRLSLLGLIAVFSTASAEFVTTQCEDKSQADVETFFGDQMGLSAGEVRNRLVLSDMLATRSFTKTWATNLDLAQFQAIDWGTEAITGANSHRFSYPYGEASGGYRSVSIPQAEPFRTLEMRARTVQDWAYRYMLQLSEQIENYRNLFPVDIVMDQQCNGRFRATHAELKLLTRMMVQGELEEGELITISVSRHMCSFCVDIVAHLARNARRRIGVIAPRKNSLQASTAIEQPEYIVFDSDGSHTRYKRRDANVNSAYACSKISFTGAIPNGLDTYHPPNIDAGETVSRQVVATGLARQLGSAVNVTDKQIIEGCTDEKYGPGNGCFWFIRSDLPKVIDCPAVGTVTGVHGSFGPLSPENPLMVLKSLGPFCDVELKQPEMGTGGTAPFEAKCPEDYQLTGFEGSFGEEVDSLGIICRRISDGEIFKSAAVGESTGGTSESQECESGAAGRQIRLWVGELAIDGLGLCCR